MKVDRVKRRDIEIKFDGGSLTSDSGLHLLKMADLFELCILYLLTFVWSWVKDCLPISSNYDF